MFHITFHNMIFISLQMSNINTELFNDTAVVKSLKSKQGIVNEPKKRGRKKLYLTDEERINARRQQQKQYRERKKQELIELRAFKAAITTNISAEQK